ncbi:Methionine aminopeptidase 1 [Jeotgalibaca dankookensis]|uniref:Methionine aminopeptidase n=1 Tax=Jeotgalibaca dankookensis TaxID=708126 RepID=A0A1S6IQF9_9LACT|nr:type I methionyl aminopeptidase [Jeotgalibaca dankookensis]AQS53793.1 Methionine aminopeptidase 1 [Jeotgalibaca dankookensis]
MITLKSPREIEAMEEAGKILAGIHVSLRDFIKPGMTTMAINEFVEKAIRDAGAIPEQIGFEGYEYATCTSVNDEICHGFPVRNEVLKDGDMVKVDTVVNYKGAMADSCWTYIVGESTPELDHLLEVTKKALYLGIEQATVGNRIGDIGHAIQTYVEAEGFSVVREFIGHGIGPTMHESPAVPHYGEAGKGLRLKEGMTLTIEPMVNTGTWRSKMDKNGWTARTRDGGISCQFEHTIAITSDGPKILTEQD